MIKIPNTSIPDLWHFGNGSVYLTAPASALFVSDPSRRQKKISFLAVYCLKVHFQHTSKINHKEVTRQKDPRSVHLPNGSGSRRLKNLQRHGPGTLPNTCTIHHSTSMLTDQWNYKRICLERQIGLIFLTLGASDEVAPTSPPTALR
jgi:hypothetical protein